MIFIYKCRNCGEKEYLSRPADTTATHAHLDKAMQGADDKIAADWIFHQCRTLDTGIADLVGSRAEKKS